jgi:hypothetical protein
VAFGTLVPEEKSQPIAFQLIPPPLNTRHGSPIKLVNSKTKSASFISSQRR